MIEEESITSSMEFEIQRLEELNSQLDLWSDHPSAYDLTLSLKKHSTLYKGASIDNDLRSPLAIQEDSDEDGSIMDREDGNEDDNDEDKYASELDERNREAREARQQAESALSQMNTEKA